MTWVRFDDQASINRKVAPLDDATYRLWHEAIEWSARNLADGQILLTDLPEVSKRANTSRAAKLVERNLWHPAGYECDSDKCPPPGPDGWVIHDYFDYQPSRAKVRAEQTAKADRQRRWLDARRAASKGASPPTSIDASKDGAPSPPRPAPKEGGAGAPQPPPAANGDGGPAGGAAKNKPNRRCPTCGNAMNTAYHRNVCERSAA